MPVPGENIRSWSTTAANNGDADSSFTWLEGQTRASVNDSARSMMAAHAKWRDLINGSITTTGSANAQAFSSGLAYSVAPEAGLIAKLKIGATLTNTASMTMNMDSLGAIAVIDAKGNALIGGEVVAGAYTDWLFNGTNWVFLGISPRYEKSAAKAWVFAGTAGNIVDSYNVSSVTDAAVGQIIVNWATAFSGANYCVIGQGLIAPGGTAASTYVTHTAGILASGITVTCVNLDNYSATDPTNWHVVAFSTI